MGCQPSMRARGPWWNWGPPTVRGLGVALAFVAVVLVAGPRPAGAEVAPPVNPQESITYWKPFVVPPDADVRVALAHRVFRRVLVGWDGPRIAPRLHVVRSSRGPWAASLEDGTILLSRDALDFCLDPGPGGEDRLAFVLAHELSHQRSDDLWHRRFFRLAGAQAPELRDRLVSGLDAHAMEVTELEEKESKADRDALVLMALVGFDPGRVVEGGDFFTRWVESIWGSSCAPDGSAPDVRDACDQAARRAIRARARLNEIANRSALFELGVQAYVRGRYADARRDFAAFGKVFPPRAVHDNIGLTHLAQALEIRARLAEAGRWPHPLVTYPLVLEARLDAPEPQALVTRGLPDAGHPVLSSEQEAALRRDLSAHVDEAVAEFTRASDLDPSAQAPLLHLGAAYVLADNVPMARGIVEGKYQRRFGSDDASRLVLALAAVAEGSPDRAVGELEALADQPVRPADGAVRYAVVRNLALLRGDPADARADWARLAEGARHAGNTALFRMAVANVNAAPPSVPAASGADRRGPTPGDKLAALPGPADGAVAADVLLEGEWVRHYRLPNGRHLLTDAEGVVLAAWQSGGAGSTRGVAVDDPADRPLKALGVPTREVPTSTGAYLAYDRLGVAFRIVGDRVAGWFVYPPRI